MGTDENVSEQALEVLAELAPDDLPAAFKSGLALAIVSGIFGLTRDVLAIPREALQQVRESIAARGDRHRRMQEAIFETEQLQDLGERARISDEVRKIRSQVNREDLVDDVYKLLADQPPIAISNPGCPSEHWLGHFWHHASTVADDELRDTFARLLIGEIARPASISIATLNTVADIDATTAERFRRIVACTIRPPDGDLPYIVHPHPFSFLDYGNTEVMDLTHEDLVRLNAAGLLTSWRATKIQFAPEVPTESVRVGNRQFSLELSGAQLSLIYLSQAGAELAPLVDVAPNPAYVQSIKRLSAEPEA